MKAEIPMLCSDDMIQGDYGISIDKYLINSPDFRLHWHNYYTLDIITNGKGQHKINGKTLDIKKGCVQLIHPTDIHAISSDNTLEIISVRFTDAVIPASLYGFVYSKSNSIFYPAQDVFSQLCSVTDSLGSILKSNRSYTQDAVEKMFSVMLDIVRSIENDDTVVMQHSSDKTLYYLNQHFRENPTLHDIANYAGMDYAYFSAYFKKHFGKTYSEYLKSLKTNYAKNLLNNSELSVSDVCFSSGFGSVSNFNAIFKKEFGLSPSQYRSNRCERE